MKYVRNINTCLRIFANIRKDRQVNKFIDNTQHRQCHTKREYTNRKSATNT